MTTIAPGSIDTGADWTPRLPAQTVAPGAIVTLTATWTIPSGPVGTWKALMSVKVNNAWTDGPTTSFTVSTTPPQVPPQPPKNLRSVKVTNSRIDLYWESDLAAITKLERSVNGSSFAALETVAAGTQHTSTSVSRRRTYAYRAKSVNAVGESDYSNTAVYVSR